jgi:hypothetical protein
MTDLSRACSHWSGQRARRRTASAPCVHGGFPGGAHEHPSDVRRGRARRCRGRSTALPWQDRGDPSTLLVYVVDLHDPRAYDYLPSVTHALEAAGSLVDVVVVQSGRYAAPLARAGVVALLAAQEHAAPQRVLAAVQREFFVAGRGLEEEGVLRGVAERLGLDAPAVELFAASPRATQLVQEDAELALGLDSDGGPLLLASRGQRLYELDGPGASGERLVAQLRTVLAAD